MINPSMAPHYRVAHSSAAGGAVRLLENSGRSAVLEAGAGVEQYDRVVLGDVAARAQRLVGRKGGAALGADVDPGARREPRRGGRRVALADRERGAPGLAHRAQTEEAAERRGDAQPPD